MQTFQVRVAARGAAILALGFVLAGCGSHVGVRGVSDVASAAHMTNCWYPSLGGLGQDGPANTENCDQGVVTYSGPADTKAPGSSSVTLNGAKYLQGRNFDIQCYSAKWCHAALVQLRRSLADKAAE